MFLSEPNMLSVSCYSFTSYFSLISLINSEINLPVSLTVKLSKSLPVIFLINASVVSLNLQNQYEQNKTKYLNMLNYYKEIVEIINKELNSNNSINLLIKKSRLFLTIFLISINESNLSLCII